MRHAGKLENICAGIYAFSRQVLVYSPVHTSMFFYTLVFEHMFHTYAICYELIMTMRRQDIHAAPSR